MNDAEFKRLFIIANPTHILNVTNYIDKYPEGQHYAILTLTYFEGYEDFLISVEKENRLNILKIFFIDQTIKGLGYYTDILKKLITVKNIRNQHPFFDEICFTNYESWLQNYLLNHFRTNKLILISDGTAIFDIVDLRKMNRKIAFGGNKFFIENISKIKPIENLHFYSPVDIDVASYDSLEVFKFKASKTNIINSKKIYVIGGPLVEAGFIKPESNLNYLFNIKKLFKDSEVVYFAHRREKDENLKEYNFFNEVILDSIPFEKRLENENELPGIIITYISSILINLPQVYPQIKFYYIPLTQKDIPALSDFHKRYFNLKNNFEKIKCENLGEFKLK